MSRGYPSMQLGRPSYAGGYWRLIRSCKRSSPEKNMIQRLIPVALLAMLCSVLFGQQTSNIVGLVQDPSGAAIAGATVTLTETQTNAKRITTANSVGEYNASSVPPGSYRIEVEKT